MREKMLELARQANWSELKNYFINHREILRDVLDVEPELRTEENFLNCIVEAYTAIALQQNTEEFWVESIATIEKLIKLLHTNMPLKSPERIKQACLAYHEGCFVLANQHMAHEDYDLALPVLHNARVCFEEMAREYPDVLKDEQFVQKLYTLFSIIGVNYRDSDDTDRSQQFYKMAMDVAESYISKEQQPSSNMLFFLHRSYLNYADAIYTQEPDTARAFLRKAVNFYDSILKNKKNKSPEEIYSAHNESIIAFISLLYFYDLKVELSLNELNEALQDARTCFSLLLSFEEKSRQTFYQLYHCFGYLIRFVPLRERQYYAKIKDWISIEEGIQDSSIGVAILQMTRFLKEADLSYIDLINDFYKIINMILVEYKNKHFNLHSLKTFLETYPEFISTLKQIADDFKNIPSLLTIMRATQSQSVAAITLHLIELQKVDHTMSAALETLEKENEVIMSKICRIEQGLLSRPYTPRIVWHNVDGEQSHEDEMDANLAGMKLDA